MNKNIEEFENVVKQLDKKKYHIGRNLKFNENGEPYIDEWSIFRKDMTLKEYFDKRNLAILSSKRGNTIEDIKKLIKGE